MAIFELDKGLTPLRALDTLLREREAARGTEPYGPTSDQDSPAGYKGMVWLELDNQHRDRLSLPTVDWFYQQLLGPGSDISQLPWDELDTFDFGFSLSQVEKLFSHTLDVYCKRCPRKRVIARVGRAREHYNLNPAWVIYHTNVQNREELEIRWSEQLWCPDCMLQKDFAPTLMINSVTSKSMSPRISMNHFWTQALFDSLIMGAEASTASINNLNKKYENFSPTKVHSVLSKGILDTQL